MSISFVALAVLILSVVCFVECDTSVQISAPSKNPEYPNKCWDEPSQTAYSVGSHNPKGSCQRIHCYPDFRIKHTSCGTHSTAQGHTIEQDLTKGYPECCAKLVKVAKKAKSTDRIDASSVRINKFRTKERLVGKTGKKLEVERPDETKSGIQAPKIVLKKVRKQEKLPTTTPQHKNDETKVQPSQEDKVQASEDGDKNSLPTNEISESGNKNAEQPETKDVRDIEDEQTTPTNEKSDDEILIETSE